MWSNTLLFDLKKTRTHSHTHMHANAKLTLADMIVGAKSAGLHQMITV